MSAGRLRLKKVAVRSTLSVGSLLFAIVGLELAYRAHTYGLRAVIPSEMRSIRALGESRLLQHSSISGVRHELKPNLKEHFKMRPFETNSHGMRDREYSLEKPADTLRIAFIGDSFTMGSGVAIENVYHSRVESRLEARSDSTPTSV